MAATRGRNISPTTLAGLQKLNKPAHTDLALAMTSRVFLRHVLEHAHSHGRGLLTLGSSSTGSGASCSSSAGTVGQLSIRTTGEGGVVQPDSANRQAHVTRRRACGARNQLGHMGHAPLQGRNAAIALGQLGAQASGSGLANAHTLAVVVVGLLDLGYACIGLQAALGLHCGRDAGSAEAIAPAPRQPAQGCHAGNGRHGQARPAAHQAEQGDSRCDHTRTPWVVTIRSAALTTGNANAIS